MPKTIVAQIEDAKLLFKPDRSDRFVYSNNYVPIRLLFDDSLTPILPFYVKQAIIEIPKSGVLKEERVHQILQHIGLKDLWERNRMDEAKKRWEETQWDSDNPDSEPTKPDADPGIRDAWAMLEHISERLGGRDREMINTISRHLEAVSPTLKPQAGAARLALPPSDQAVARPSVLEQQDVAFISGVVQPQVGFAFLDRTRISPVGFALGEHTYALGLAPGEEVVLEQKTFTKRQMTLEEQTEQERQFDLELASTYSTELQEGLERQRSLTDSWGLNASHTGQYTSPQFPWGQITASHTIGTAKNVTEASQQISRRSVKDTQTASGKVSARYRTQHKTTFRVVTEVGFESTSKRTIRNPNRTTPLTLHFFKVLQKLQMKQERYGVRLCWALHVKDPAATFFGKLAAARKAVIDEAIMAMPPKPVEPTAPPTDENATPTNRVTKFASSPIRVADKWGASGDMSAEYDVDVPIASGYTWDGRTDNVEIAIFSKRPDHTISRWVVGTPYPVEGSALRVQVHIGAPSWIFGPGISFQIKVNTYQDVAITEKAAKDTKYFDDLAMYRTALKQWQDNYDAALAEAQKTADAQEKRLLAQLSPINEMIGQIIEQHFPASVRDEMWEIDNWQRLFDWERATFTAYPGWWSGMSARDPLLDPSDFINASWSKLYLPIQLGMERSALRWIFGKVIDSPLEANVERTFDELIADLDDYRQTWFGSADEMEDLAADCQPVKDLHKCIATWEELMPTDGTHIEAIQGITSAADPITAKEISDAAELRTALLENEKRAAKLKDKAETIMRGPADVAVHISSGGGTPQA